VLKTINISNAAEDLPKVTQLVKENGTAIFILNNEHYIVQQYNNKNEFADDLSVQKTSEEFIQKYLEAFKELAK